MARSSKYPETPDGRYFVSKGRLYRKTDPRLSDTVRRAGIKALMQARRAAQLAQTDVEADDAKAAVDKAKRALGERGPVWWDDGAPDEAGRHPLQSSYRCWWEGLDTERRALGDPEGLG